MLINRQFRPVNGYPRQYQYCSNMLDVVSLVLDNSKRCLKVTPNLTCNCLTQASPVDTKSLDRGGPQTPTEAQEVSFNMNITTLIILAFKELREVNSISLSNRIPSWFR